MSSLNRFVTLGEISERIGDGLHGTPEYSKNGEYFFINGNNLIDGEIILNEKTKSCSESEYDKYKKNLSNNTILISINGTIGNLAFYKGENVILGKSACYINIKSDVDKNFIYYVLKSSKFQNYIKSQATGSTIKNVSLKLLRDYVLELPDIIQQKRISKILSNLDDKIRINNQINQTLESIAQAIFKSWFIDFDPVRAKMAAKQEGKGPELAAMCVISGKSESELEQMSEEDFAELQDTAALFPDEFVDGELGEVPKGWEILDIDKTTSLIIDHRGKTPKKLGSDWSDIGITVLSAKHVKDGCIVNREQLRFVDLDLYSKWMKEELEEGDILLTSEGPMGEMYYLAFDEKYCLSQRLYALRANTDLISSAFLYFWLLSPLAKSDMNGRATGTTVVGIRQAELRKVKVLTPSKAICDLFNEKVKAQLKKITLNNSKSLNLAHIRDALLPKLMSGELDVSCLKDEVG